MTPQAIIMFEQLFRSLEIRHKTRRKVPPKYSSFNLVSTALWTTRHQETHHPIVLSYSIGTSLTVVTLWSSDSLRLTTTSASVAKVFTVPHVVPLELVALRSGNYFHYT
jgi:hypothetical protein